MAEIIIMPKLGFDMGEGQLVKWYKSEGDYVRTGELFFEINTDKTTMPVESFVDGFVLKILLEEGETAPVFTPIAVVGEAGEDADAALEAQSAPSAANSEFGIRNSELKSEREAGALIAVETISLANTKITPRARKYIDDNKIDPGRITQIKGTGFEGGITEYDIKAAMTVVAPKATPLARKIAALDGIELSSVRGSGPKGKIIKSDIVKNAESGIRNPELTREDGKLVLSTTPYTGVRKIIGDKLSASMKQSPHIFFTDAVDTGPMNAFREKVSEALGMKISVTDMLAIAASRALTEYPGVNSALIGDSIVSYRSTNIGIAVAGDRGLIVPVIKDVQQKTITEVAEESRLLIERARNGTLRPDEYSGGTFTISNLGMFGIDNFTAIINPPEAAILAVSAAKKKPVVVTKKGKDQVDIKTMMNIQLSADHRLIDGLLAAQFVAYLKELLEKPLLLGG